MGMLSKVLDCMVFKGGIMVTGLIGMCLAHNRQLPPYMLLVSTGIASLGVIGLMVTGYRGIIRQQARDERMAEFERIRPALERHIRETTDAWVECRRFLRARDRTERWAEQSQRLVEPIRMVEQAVRQREQAEVEPLLNEQSSSSQHTGQIPQEGTGHGQSQEQVENLPAPEQKGSSEDKDVAEEGTGHGLSQEQVENLPAPEQEGSSEDKVDIAETATEGENLQRTK